MSPKPAWYGAKRSRRLIRPSLFSLMVERRKAVNGANTAMVRQRGRGKRGARVVGCVPHGHCKTLTFVAGLRGGAITAPFVIDRPMNGKIFQVYLNKCLVPTLSPGDIVVMDNLQPTSWSWFARPSRQRVRHFSICRHTQPI